MLTNRMPSFPSVAAGFCILLLNLTAPHTHTSKSRMPTIPATSPPKKVPAPRGALAAVHVAGKHRSQFDDIQYMVGSIVHIQTTFECMSIYIYTGLPVGSSNIHVLYS